MDVTNVDDEINSPSDAASHVLYMLSELWLAEFGDDNLSNFENELLTPMLLDPHTSGEKLINELLRSLEDDQDCYPAGNSSGLAMLRIALAFSVEQIRADAADDTVNAWKLGTKASFWHGMATAMLTQRDQFESKEAYAEAMISRRAKENAEKRHKEHREMYIDAVKWLDAHYEKDKLNAAQAAVLLKEIIPVALSTCKTYVARWKKPKEGVGT